MGTGRSQGQQSRPRGRCPRVPSCTIQEACAPTPLLVAETGCLHIQGQQDHGPWIILTKGDNDGAGDAVGHDDREDAAGPGILQSKLELIGLALGHNQQHHYCLCCCKGCNCLCIPANKAVFPC